VLTPRDTTSRVRTVKIAVDGEKKIPVSVQIFARADTATPSLDVSFTRLSFAAPDNNNFAFTPSKNAKVVEQKITSADQLGAHAHAGLTGDSQFTSVGKGWTTVGIARTGDLLGSAGGSAQKKAQSDALRTLGALPRVSGAWGSGRLFDSKLVTALFTDDGRVIFGAVDPQVLYATAASHK